MYNIIAMSAFLFLVIYTRKQIAGGDVSCDVAYEELQDRSNHKKPCFHAGCSPESLVASVLS